MPEIVVRPDGTTRIVRGSEAPRRVVRAGSQGPQGPKGDPGTGGGFTPVTDLWEVSSGSFSGTGPTMVVDGPGQELNGYLELVPLIDGNPPPSISALDAVGGDTPVTLLEDGVYSVIGVVTMSATLKVGATLSSFGISASVARDGDAVGPGYWLGEYDQIVVPEMPNGGETYGTSRGDLPAAFLPGGTHLGVGYVLRPGGTSPQAAFSSLRLEYGWMAITRWA